MLHLSTHLVIEISSPTLPPIVGDTATYTCISLLGHAKMIEWMDVTETVVASNERLAHLDLVFSQVTHNMNGSVHTCRVQFDSNVTATQPVTVVVRGELILNHDPWMQYR